jgi:hypothetical protein
MFHYKTRVQPVSKIITIYSNDFFEILDLSSPNIRQKYLEKTKCLKKNSLQATAVDRCAIGIGLRYLKI